MILTQYLTYEEYLDLGGTLGEAAFPAAELKARKRIDAATHGRAQRMAERRAPEPMPEEIRVAMAEIIAADSAFGAAALAVDPPVAGFATDGYSESYGDAAQRSREADRRVYECLALLLYGVTDDDGTPLLYAGLG